MRALGTKFADQGFVAVGCPLGSDAFAQSKANSSDDNTVERIKSVLELPLSAWWSDVYEGWCHA